MFALGLAAVALCLALMSTFSHVSHHLAGEYAPGSLLESVLAPLDAFYLDRERSFPTLYVSLLWLLCSVLLAGIAFSDRASATRHARQWGALALIFLFLFTDELLQFHEEIGEPLRNALGTSGVLYYAWIMPALVLLAILGALYAGFVVALPAEIRRLFLIAGAIFVAGAIGMEMVGGYMASSYGLESAALQASSTVEELLEMLGITIFIHALLEYMRRYVGEMIIPPAGKKL